MTVKTYRIKGQYDLKSVQKKYFKISLFQGKDDIILIRMLLISPIFLIITSTILPCWWWMQRPRTDHSTEYKQLLGLIPQWDISVSSSKAQGDLPRGSRKNARPRRGREVLWDAFLDMAWPSHLLTHRNCGYLPKACSQWGPSAFQHG